MSERLELGSKFFVIVRFSVVDYLDGPGLIRHWLMTVGDVDDAQAARSHDEIRLDEGPVVIGAPMPHRAAGRMQALGGDRRTVCQIQRAQDPAHRFAVLEVMNPLVG
jgi:hypothetical protein